MLFGGHELLLPETHIPLKKDIRPMAHDQYHDIMYNIYLFKLQVLYFAESASGVISQMHSTSFCCLKWQISIKHTFQLNI